MPAVVGGQWRSSKEFTPGMVAGVFAELALEQPRRRLTIGIDDDVSGTSLPYDPDLDIEPAELSARVLRARLGRHGRREQETRSRSSAPTREFTLRATSSTTRRSRAPRRCRIFASAGTPSGPVPGEPCELRRLPPAQAARPARGARPRGARRHAGCCNCPYDPGDVWEKLSRPVREQIVAKGIELVRDRRGPDRPRRPAFRAAPTRSSRRASSRPPGFCHARRRSSRIKASIEKTYGRRGDEIVRRNNAAVDSALDGLHKIDVPRSPAAGARSLCSSRTMHPSSSAR